MRWTPVAPLAASLTLFACNLNPGGDCRGTCGASLDLDDTGTGTDTADTEPTESGGPLNFWPGVVCAPHPDETPRFYFDLRAGKDPERDYFRLPYPADLRRKGGGIDLQRFPRAPAELAPAPELTAVIDRWTAHIEQDTACFALEGSVFFSTCAPPRGAGQVGPAVPSTTT